MKYVQALFQAYGIGKTNPEVSGIASMCTSYGALPVRRNTGTHWNTMVITRTHFIFFLFYNIKVHFYILIAVCLCVGCCFWLFFFVLRFYGPVNPMGSCRAQCLPNHTFTGQA